MWLITQMKVLTWSLTSSKAIKVYFLAIALFILGYIIYSSISSDNQNALKPSGGMQNDPPLVLSEPLGGAEVDEGAKGANDKTSEEQDDKEESEVEESENEKPAHGDIFEDDVESADEDDVEGEEEIENNDGKKDEQQDDMDDKRDETSNNEKVHDETTNETEDGTNNEATDDIKTTADETENQQSISDEISATQESSEISKNEAPSSHPDALKDVLNGILPKFEVIVDKANVITEELVEPDHVSIIDENDMKHWADVLSSGHLSKNNAEADDGGDNGSDISSLTDATYEESKSEYEDEEVEGDEGNDNNPTLDHDVNLGNDVVNAITEPVVSIKPKSVIPIAKILNKDKLYQLIESDDFEALSTELDNLDNFEQIWDLSGSNLLHRAVSQKSMRCIEVLLARSQSDYVNMRTRGERRATVLHLIIDRKPENISDFLGVLIKAGADVNANSGSDSGYTSLMVAIAYNNLEAMETLLTYGANPNLLFQGLPLLHHSFIYCGMEGIDLLLSNGADPVLANKFNRPALHEAVVTDKIEIVRLLVGKHKCDINLRNPSDPNPKRMHSRELKYAKILYSAIALHYAVKEGRFSLARELVKMGAMRSLEDQYKKTPLFYDELGICGMFF